MEISFLWQRCLGIKLVHSFSSLLSYPLSSGVVSTAWIFRLPLSGLKESMLHSAQILQQSLLAHLQLPSLKSPANDTCSVFYVCRHDWRVPYSAAVSQQLQRIFPFGLALHIYLFIFLNFFFFLILFSIFIGFTSISLQFFSALLLLHRAAAGKTQLHAVISQTPKSFCSSRGTELGWPFKLPSNP